MCSLPRFLPALALGLAACSAPGGTGSAPIYPDLSQPTASASKAPASARPSAPRSTSAPNTFFRGRLLRQGAPLTGVTVYLREFPAGSLPGKTNGSRPRVDRHVETDADGKFALPSDVSDSLLFSAMYDAGSEHFEGDPAKKRLGTNTTEAQRVIYGATLMEPATQVDHPDVEVGWNLAAMRPLDGASLTQAQASFTAAPYPKAQQYELLVLDGDEPDSGSPVLHKVQTSTSFTWTTPPTGSYFYQINAVLRHAKLQSPWAQITITP